jgi:hypothetical protein
MTNSTAIPARPTNEEVLAGLLQASATPRWIAEIDDFLPIKSQFVLHGNIRDRHPFSIGKDQYGMVTTEHFLVEFLRLKGFEHFLSINPIQGVSILTPSADDARQTAEKSIKWLSVAAPEWSKAHSFTPDPKGKIWRAEVAKFSVAVELADLVARNTAAPAAVFFGYLMGQTEQGQTKETDPFVQSLIASYEVKPLRQYYNTIFWLCDRENDLPAWFTLNNPRIRSIPISKPNIKIRKEVAKSLLMHASGFDSLDENTRDVVIGDFCSSTEGMLINDLEAVVRFLPSQNLAATEISEAVRRYKLGVKEDHWQKIDRQQFRRAEALIRLRVRGQEPAITKSLDIIRRAQVGLSGAHVSRSSGKPKGVLFFAGPTGVGKTELAKSITQAIFGDETAYIRFDMSEFNLDHSDQRLVGAPPGYIGFEAGGELTAAIREKPFSVVLFDEIEKAHNKVLDKFLQILDDGQLTSGKGERVYFSDAVIIFTSNLGMKGVPPGCDYADLEQKIKKGVYDYFHETLKRPELLNRVGDNIVVFDFIRPDIAIQILAKMVGTVLERLKEVQGFDISLSGFPYNTTIDKGTVFGALADRCLADLSNGGRGIGNVLESCLINPLSRALFDREMPPGSRAQIARIGWDGPIPELELELL